MGIPFRLPCWNLSFSRRLTRLAIYTTEPTSTGQYTGEDKIQNSVANNIASGKHFTISPHRQFSNKVSLSFIDCPVYTYFFRYEKYWLPFLSSISSSPEQDSEFCPPLDIHWVWHTHMLAPVSYSLDTVAVTGRMIGHTLTSPQVRE